MATDAVPYCRVPLEVFTNLDEKRAELAEEAEKIGEDLLSKYADRVHPQPGECFTRPLTEEERRQYGLEGAITVEKIAPFVAQGMRAREIAAHLGSDAKTVAVIISRNRKRLGLLGEDGVMGGNWASLNPGKAHGKGKGITLPPTVRRVEVARAELVGSQVQVEPVDIEPIKEKEEEIVVSVLTADMLRTKVAEAKEQGRDLKELLAELGKLHYANKPSLINALAIKWKVVTAEEIGAKPGRRSGKKKEEAEQAGQMGEIEFKERPGVIQEMIEEAVKKALEEYDLTMQIITADFDRSIAALFEEIDLLKSHVHQINPHQYTDGPARITKL